MKKVYVTVIISYKKCLAPLIHEVGFV